MKHLVCYQAGCQGSGHQAGAPRIVGAVLSITRQTLDYNGLIRDSQGTISTTGVDIHMMQDGRVIVEEGL